MLWYVMKCLDNLWFVLVAVRHALTGSGEAIMKWRNQERAYPVAALGFNHRAESFYRCDEEDPKNKNVTDTRLRGLKKVRVLHFLTPECVLHKNCLPPEPVSRGECPESFWRDAGGAKYMKSNCTQPNKSNQICFTNYVFKAVWYESLYDVYCCHYLL